MQVVKRIWEYVKDHGLQNPADKRKIVLDDKLSVLFKQPLTMFSLPKQLQKHCFVDGVFSALVALNALMHVCNTTSHLTLASLLHWGLFSTCRCVLAIFLELCSCLQRVCIHQAVMRADRPRTEEDEAERPAPKKTKAANGTAAGAKKSSKKKNEEEDGKPKRNTEYLQKKLLLSEVRLPCDIFLLDSCFDHAECCVTLCIQISVQEEVGSCVIQDMAEWIGAPEATRTEVTTHFWKYVKDNGLQVCTIAMVHRHHSQALQC